MKGRNAILKVMGKIVNILSNNKFDIQIEEVKPVTSIMYMDGKKQQVTWTYDQTVSFHLTDIRHIYRVKNHE